MYPEKFWAKNKIHYPFVSRLFRRYACIRSGEARIERFFSLCKRILDSGRRFTGDNLRVIVMQSLWENDIC